MAYTWELCVKCYKKLDLSLCENCKEREKQEIQRKMKEMREKEDSTLSLNDFRRELKSLEKYFGYKMDDKHRILRNDTEDLRKEVQSFKKDFEDLKKQIQEHMKDLGNFKKSCANLLLE